MTARDRVLAELDRLASEAAALRDHVAAAPPEALGAMSLIRAQCSLPDVRLALARTGRELRGSPPNGCRSPLPPAE